MASGIMNEERKKQGKARHLTGWNVFIKENMEKGKGKMVNSSAENLAVEWGQLSKADKEEYARKGQGRYGSNASKTCQKGRHYPGQNSKDSRVCYSTPQICSTHKLQCDHDQKIGITGAHYHYLNRTEYTECRCGSYKCDDSCVTSRMGGKLTASNSYNHADYLRLLSTCSFKYSCSYPVPRQNPGHCSSASECPSYSYVPYECFSDNVDFCNGTNEGKKLSILYTSSSQKLHCQCSIKGNPKSGNDKRDYFIRIIDAISQNRGDVYFTLRAMSRGRDVTASNRTLTQSELRQFFKAQRKEETTIQLTWYQMKETMERLWITITDTRSVSVECRSVSNGVTSTTVMTPTNSEKMSTYRNTPLPHPASTTQQHEAHASASIFGFISAGTAGVIAVTVTIIAGVLIIMRYKSLISLCLQKVEREGGGPLDSPRLAYADMVQSDDDNVSGTTTHFTTENGLADTSTQSDAPSVEEKDDATCLSLVWKALEIRRVPEESRTVIMSSWRSST